MLKEYFFELLNIQCVSSNSIKPVFQVFLRPVQKLLNYKAGQYLEILYPNGSFQPFSIANAPTNDGKLELLIRIGKEDSLSQKFLTHLNTTKHVQILGPFGNCTFEKFLHHPTLLLSGGGRFFTSKSNY